MRLDRLLVVGGAVLACAAGLVLYAFDPSTPGILPPCPFHALTGLHCPGCGSLRALHALLHGELASAFAFNPLTTSLVPLLAIGVAREARRIVSGRDDDWPRLPAWTIRAFVALVLVFAVLRNLPSFAWLAPHALAVAAAVR